MTAIAQADTLRQLMEQASKIPWDDRRCLGASVLDVSPTLVRRHLHQAGSHLAEEPLPDEDLYRKLRLTVPVNAHTEPRNVALLFFQDDPRRFFPGARIELCEFPEGRGGDLLIEHTFAGPLPEQLRACQNYFEGLLGNITQKPAAGLQAQRIIPYPLRALQEALVNAVYHRSYESSEPTKVYIEPDSIVITSYPGPHPAIGPEHFRPGNTVPDVPARNRRIGELLKELRIAEARGSGILKIQRALADNGSPPAEIDCDPTFFSVRIPIHGTGALAAAVELSAPKHLSVALETIKRAFSREPQRWILACFGIQLATQSRDLVTARRFVEGHLAAAGTAAHAFPVLQYVNSLVTGRLEITVANRLTPGPLGAMRDEVVSLVLQIPRFSSIDVSLNAAYWLWCAGEFGEAQILLEQEYSDSAPVSILDWVDSLVLLAGVQLDLAAGLEEEVAEQLLAETEDRLEGAIETLEPFGAQRTERSLDLGRLYLRLAQVLKRLGKPSRSVSAAAQQYAERAQDKEALTLLASLFPSPSRSAARK